MVQMTWMPSAASTPRQGPCRREVLPNAVAAALMRWRLCAGACLPSLPLCCLPPMLPQVLGFREIPRPELGFQGVDQYFGACRLCVLADHLAILLTGHLTAPPAQLQRHLPALPSTQATG